MKQRQLIDTGQAGGAEFSACRRWRWTLTRVWDPAKPTISFVGLNPSVADENKLDRTTAKCVKWAERDGFGKYVMLNLYGLVSTLPSGLKKAFDPVGPDNDEWIQKTFAESAAVVFCWGATWNKFTGPRIEVVTELARAAGLKPLCPGLTKAGFPLHPCRLANATRLIPFEISK